MSPLEILSVAGIGIGVVFCGLVIIVILCKISSFVIMRIEKAVSPGAKDDISKTQAANTAAGDDILSGAKHSEVVAAVSAAISEYTGKDVSGFRILSIKRKGE